MRKFSFFIAVLILVLNSNVSWALQKRRDVLLVGDSWANLMCLHGSFSEALKAAGYREFKVHCVNTSKMGTHVADWNSGNNKRNIKLELKVHRSIKMVYISIGGNDIFKIWKKEMTPEEVQAMVDYIREGTEKIISTIRSIRPGVKIVLSSYEYPNFEDLKKLPFETSYSRIYARMGQPTPLELNLMLIRFTQEQENLAKRLGIEFVNHVGSLQYRYGLKDYDIPPRTVELPWGNPAFPSPPEGMIQIATNKFTFTDPFHISKGNFNRFAERVVNEYFFKWYPPN